MSPNCPKKLTFLKFHPMFSQHCMPYSSIFLMLPHVPPLHNLAPSLPNIFNIPSSNPKKILYIPIPFLKVFWHP
jgi:hypothetical protein